jgi:aconitate hydratase
LTPKPIEPVENAYILALLGDSITTDHISPAGSIKAHSPAGLYLLSKNVQEQDINSYGARRGNHEIMIPYSAVTLLFIFLIQKEY